MLGYPEQFLYLVNKMRLILLFAISLLSVSVFSQADNKALNDILTKSKLAWKKYQTKHFNFIVEEDQYPDQHIDHIKNDFELKRKDIIGFLENEMFSDTANIIIVDTKEKVAAILGFEVQGFAIPENNIAIFLYNKTYSLATKHELAHYYAFHIWGRPADNWFSEGLAVYYDNKWNGHQVDSLTKHLKDNNKLFAISTLSKKFYSLDPMIAYPQIGSFTSFLISRYGKTKMKELWIRGFKDIKLIYEISRKELEDEWLKDLDKIANVNIDYNNYLKQNPKR
jgi:hypothetical protein